MEDVGFYTFLHSPPLIRIHANEMHSFAKDMQTKNISA